MESGGGDGYAFRPAAAADLPMLRRWLETPEPRRWWGDPEEQAELLAADLSEPGMSMLVVTHAGRPFAYAQHYDVHRWPQPHLEALPRGARGIDAFIGEPEMIGRGHGSAFMRLLAERLIAEGAPLVAIDPDPENLRAREAFARAGFRFQSLVKTSDGLAALMIVEAGGRAEGRPSDLRLIERWNRPIKPIG